jgi:hypothetical protein
MYRYVAPGSRSKARVIRTFIGITLAGKVMEFKTDRKVT